MTWPARRLSERSSPRGGQTEVAQVVIQIEARVVHPYRVIRERDPGESLAIAWHEFRLDQGPNTIDVHAAFGAGEWSDIEDRHGAHVHRCAVVLDLEEGGVKGRQTLVVRGSHSFYQPRL